MLSKGLECKKQQYLRKRRFGRSFGFWCKFFKKTQRKKCGFNLHAGEPVPP